MSDIMLHGVLRMPPELWDDGAIDKAQRHSRYIQASDEIYKLQAELAEAQAHNKDLSELLQMMYDSFVDCVEGGEADELMEMVKKAISTTTSPTEALDRVVREAVEKERAAYEEVLADHRRLVRELDVIWNGEDGAAKQASLCDVVSQIKREAIRKG